MPTTDTPPTRCRHCGERIFLSNEWSLWRDMGGAAKCSTFHAPPKSPQARRKAADKIVETWLNQVVAYRTRELGSTRTHVVSRHEADLLKAALATALNDKLEE